MKHFRSLRAWRRDRGWSQREAAAHLRTTQNSYKNWERGKNLPRPQTLRRVIAKTGVVLEDLLRERLRQKHPTTRTEDRAREATAQPIA